MKILTHEKNSTFPHKLTAVIVREFFTFCSAGAVGAGGAHYNKPNMMQGYVR